MTEPNEEKIINLDETFEPIGEQRYRAMAAYACGTLSREAWQKLYASKLPALLIMLRDGSNMATWMTIDLKDHPGSSLAEFAREAKPREITVAIGLVFDDDAFIPTFKCYAQQVPETRQVN